MSNQAYFAEAAQLTGVSAGEVLTIGGDEGHHAVSVKRVRVGEALDLVDGAGRRAVVTVTEVQKRAFSARVERVLDEPVPATRIVLVQALAKGDRDLQAVEAAVELGVSAVLPWQAERCVVRWAGEKQAKGRQKWESTVRAAVKQSRRAYAPAVWEPMSTAEIAKSLGEPGSSQDDGGGVRLALVLHEAAAAPFASRLEDAKAALNPGETLEELWLLVGPEGGISEREIDALTAAGAQTAVLGRHVLRSGTAGPAAIVLGRHLLGDLD